MKACFRTASFLIDCVRLNVEAFLRPNDLANRMVKHHPPLPADFSLLQIRLNHLRDPGFWRLIVQGFAFPFAVMIFCFALGLWWLHVPNPRATNTVINLAACMMTVTFLVSLTLRLSIAIPCQVTFGLAMGLTWLGVYTQIDLVNPNETLAWYEAFRESPVLFALGPFVFGLAFSVASHPSPGDRKRSFGADLGAAVLGGIIATASVIVLFFVPKLYHTFRFLGVTTDCVVAGLVVALLLGSTTYLKIQRVRPAVFIGMGAVIFHTLATELLVVNPSTLGPIAKGIRHAAGSMRLQSLNVAYVIFAYAVAKRWGGQRAGLMAALLAILVEKIVYGLSIISPVLPTGLRAVACLPILFGACLGATQRAWRPILFYPIAMAWNLLLWRSDRERTQGPLRLGWHSAFWDKGQWLPLTGLDEHLLLAWEKAPVEAIALERALASGPQRWAALAARVELEARRFESCANLQAVAKVHTEETPSSNQDPKTRPLRDLVRLSHDLDAAMARSQGSPYHYRAELVALSLRLARHEEDWTLADHTFIRRMARVAARWRRLIESQIDAPSGPHEVELLSPYIIGMPLPARQDLFVGRHEVAAKIERLVADPLQPPILLYGQRRVGKTSLLHNLGQRLPSHVLPLFVDLMGPVSSSTNHAGFLCALARAIRRSAMNQADLNLDPLPIEQLSENAFLHFDTWLDHFDQVFNAHGFQLALLALDEFETLAPKQASLDPIPILHLFRHILQHRRHFRLLFAGSHSGYEIEALSEFLINAQLIHLGRLTDGEARHLIEHPVPGFGLGYDTLAVDHVVTLTGRHPFLLQLLCRDIVGVKNHQPLPQRWHVTTSDVEEAILPALQHGRMFFEDLAQNQIPEPVKHGLIRLARLGPSATLSIDESGSHDVIDFGLRREILEPIGTRWQFTIELVRRWFALT